MNNNNIYFSCFSLIRACVSSLFDNFFKVVAVCLIVCFVLLSPAAAFASTTESIMMYVSDDDYAVMPLAALEDFNFDVRTGIYDIKSDSFTWGNKTSYSVSNGVTTGKSSWIERPFSYDNLFAFEITVNDLNHLSDIRLLLGAMNFCARLPDSSEPMQLFYYSRDNLQVFKSFYTANWSGTLNYGISHVSSTATSTHSLPGGFFQPYVVFSGFYQGMMDLTLPLEVPSPSHWEYYSSSHPESEYTVYNTGVNSFSITVVLDLTRDMHSTDNLYIFDFLEEGEKVLYRTYVQGNIAVIQSDENNSSDVSSSVISSLSSSISSMGSSINTNISQLKTQITQSTNTITTKIDTMSNDVKTGLQNVVTSAQQNTQNIINTVTQKVDEVKTGITEVKDSILDLPNKLQEMLTEFIVPDAETMGGKYSEFTELLEEKLGVIYQIPAMILELFETLVSGVINPQTTLTFPSLSLPWIDGTQMKLWDSIEFEIIPTGMDVLKELIQTVTSMVCVIMTFNSVKRIYENFLRGR